LNIQPSLFNQTPTKYREVSTPQVKVANFDEYLAKKGINKFGSDVAMAKMPNASEVKE
jgi:hypothetical protein